MLDDIVKDLHALEPPIDGFFKDVEQLRAAKHGKTDYYHGKYVSTSAVARKGGGTLS